MRAWMPARAILSLALCAAVVLLAPASAPARRAVFTLPVPNAGDVTLARILVSSTPVGRGPRSLSLQGQGRPPVAGTQIAWAGTITGYSGGRSLADVVVAVARPAAAHEAGPARVTLRLVGRHVRASLLRLVGESNVRFFGSGRCGTYIATVEQARAQGRVIRGAWRGLASRNFVLGALGYGCPDAGLGGDETFEAPMLGALGTGFVSWVASEQGSGHLCVYVHDAPGVSGTVGVEGRAGGSVEVPYSVPASGVALVRVDTGTGGFNISLSRARPGARTRTWEVSAVILAPSTGPPVPAPLAAAAGAC